MQSLTAHTLMAESENIMRQWENIVRTKLPSAAREDKLALRDSLPVLIKYMAQALETGLYENKDKLLYVAHKHGSERANKSDYKIEEALEEFNILRKILFQELEKKVQISQRDRDIIYEVIQLGLSKAGAEFAKTQLKREEEARRLAQERFEEKQKLEERLSLALEVSDVGIWEYHYSNNLFIITKEESIIYGWPEDKTTASLDEARALFHPDDIPMMQNKVSEAIQNGQSFMCEYRLRFPDNTIKWISCKGRPIKNDTNEIYKVIGTDIDITFRKQAVEKLEEASRRMELLTDVQPSLIAVVDKNLTYLFANRTYEQVLKVPRSEIIGKTMRERLGEKVWHQIEPYVKRALSGEHVTFEAFIDYTEGRRYVKVNYLPNLNSKNEVEGIYISVMDLTDQMHMLDALRKSEEEFRTLSNAIPQITWMAESDGRIYWFNNRWYEFTGASSNKMDQNWSNYIHEEYRTPVMKLFKSQILKEDVWEDVFPIRSNKNEYRWFLSRAIPLKDQNGRVTKWLGTNTDVTEQKKITDELHQEQKLRDRFISTLSHDLRTPLTAAKIAAQLTKRKYKDDQSIASQSDRIIKNIDRADKMIQDLLDANRLKAGQIIKPSIEEFNIYNTVCGALEEIKAIHGDRFVMNGSNGLDVYSWEQGIVRILENLCSNAVKYGDPDRPVEVKLEEMDNFFHLKVHNYGTPIEENRNLFSAFQRANSAENSDQKGWGIGLAVVKGITESLGGEVQVERHKDGTTFFVILPKDSRYCNVNSVVDNHHH